MSKLETLETEIRALTREQALELQDWLSDYLEDRAELNADFVASIERGKADLREGRVRVEKRRPFFVIDRVVRSLNVRADLLTEVIFQPVVIQKSHPIHTGVLSVGLDQASAKDAGKKLHAVTSVQRQAVALKAGVEGQKVVPMILIIVPRVKRLVHFVTQQDVVPLQAAQLKIHRRADYGDKIIFGADARGRLVALKKNVVVVLSGHRYMGSHAHRPKAVNQDVARVEGQRPRARCKKPCRNCQTTLTASRMKHYRFLGQGNMSGASQTR